MNDPTRIHGMWRLLSFLEQKDGRWEAALDPGAHGYISYWPSGHMQVVLVAAERPRLRGDWSDIPAQDKAVCLDKLVAYGGRYSVEADRLLHHLDTCWIPNWEGRDLVREMSFPSDNQLLLATVPDNGPRPRPAQRVLWERVA